MTVEIGLFAAVHTMRAMRRLTPDLVPNTLIHMSIAAAVEMVTIQDRWGQVWEQR
jgi:hypothetical protein